MFVPFFVVIHRYGFDSLLGCYVRLLFPILFGSVEMSHKMNDKNAQREEDNRKYNRVAIGISFYFMIGTDFISERESS